MAYLRKKKPITKKQVFYYDDREKKPISIDHPRFTFERKRLVTGDYTLKGYEAIGAIERKSGWSEILQNLCPKNRPTFKRCLERLADLPIRVMMIEDDFSYQKLQAAARYGSMNAINSILHWNIHIQTYYNIPIVYTGKRKSIKDESTIKLLLAFEEKCMHYKK